MAFPRWNYASGRPCFCDSCMQLGGPRREAMRAEVLGGLRELMDGADFSEPLPEAEVIRRRRERQRTYDANGRGARRAAAHRAKLRAQGGVA